MDKYTFMFGKLCNSESDYNYEEIVKIYSKYEIMFNEYINYVYTNTDSMIIQYNLYKSNVLNFEQTFNKYVFEFNLNELEELLKSIPSDSINIVNSVYGLVNQYINYAISIKKLATFNMMESMDKGKYVKVNQRVLKENIINLNDFWKMIYKMQSKTDIENLTPFVMGRYGIIGSGFSYMRNLKYSNIEKDYKVCWIEDDENKISLALPVDDDFIRFCDNLYNKNKKEMLLNQESESKIYNRMNKALIENEMKSMKVNNLYKSRLLDILFNIRAERRLITEDFKEIINMFYPNSSAGRYSSMVKWYKNLTNDDVISSLSPKKAEQLIIDDNAKESVLKIKESINF